MRTISTIKIMKDGLMTDKSYKPQQIQGMFDVCVEEFKTCNNGVLLTAIVKDESEKLEPTGQEPVIYGGGSIRLIHLSKVGGVDFDRDLFAEIYGEEKLSIIDTLNNVGIVNTQPKKEIIVKDYIDNKTSNNNISSSNISSKTLKDSLWDLQEYLQNIIGNPKKQDIINRINKILREL